MYSSKLIYVFYFIFVYSTMAFFLFMVHRVVQTFFLSPSPSNFQFQGGVNGGSCAGGFGVCCFFEVPPVLHPSLSLLVLLSLCPPVIMSSSHRGHISSYWHVLLSSCLCVLLSSCLRVLLSSCLHAPNSSGPHVRMPYFIQSFISSCRLDSMSACPHTFLSSCSHGIMYQWINVLM